MRHLHVAALNGGEICECGHPAEEHVEGYICTHKLDDPEDGWYGVCPCVRYADELDSAGRLPLGGFPDGE